MLGFTYNVRLFYRTMLAGLRQIGTGLADLSYEVAFTDAHKVASWSRVIGNKMFKKTGLYCE